MFRGGCTGPTVGYDAQLAPLYLRYRATALTHRLRGKFDAGLSSACVDAAPASALGKGAGGSAGLGKGAGDSAGLGLGLSPLQHVDTRTGQCRHKHLLLLDGNTASGRSSQWFAAGSTVFKPDSVFSEWFYHSLRPWVHYVPVRERLEDLEAQFDFVAARPRLGECIARNSAAFAAKHLRREALACYFHRLMTAWSRNMPSGSRGEEAGFRRI